MKAKLNKPKNSDRAMALAILLSVLTFTLVLMIFLQLRTIRNDVNTNLQTIVENLDGLNNAP